MFFAIATVPAGLHQLPVPGDRECYDFDLFADAVAKNGGKITQTIETPSVPSVARMVVVTYEGTKEVFAATASCVIVPAAYIDTPDEMDDKVPYLILLPALPPAKS